MAAWYICEVCRRSITTGAYQDRRKNADFGPLCHLQNAIHQIQSDRNLQGRIHLAIVRRGWWMLTTRKSYELLIDPYHKVPRLNLYRFDGSPMAPMYIWSTTPNMLPTTTIHPQATHTGKASRAMRRIKRRADQTAFHYHDIDHKRPQPAFPLVKPNTIWYMGVGLSGLGGVLYFWFWSHWIKKWLHGRSFTAFFGWEKVTYGMHNKGVLSSLIASIVWHLSEPVF